MDMIKLYLIAEIALIALFLLGGAVFMAFAVMKRDYEFIQRRPFMFLIELLIVSIIPAVPILFFVVSRNMEMGVALPWFYGLSIKFAIFHILFQVSGFYTFLFSA